jgi:hypothetical protein
MPVAACGLKEPLSSPKRGPDEWSHPPATSVFKRLHGRSVTQIWGGCFTHYTYVLTV